MDLNLQSCPCCVYPLVLGTTVLLLVLSKLASATSGAGGKDTKPSIVNRIFTAIYRITSVLVAIASIGLGVLSSSPDLRGRVFANLCTSMIKSSKLDAYRCGLTRDISGKVLEFGPGPGTNFRCWNQSDISSWVGVEPNTHFSAALEASAQQYSIAFPRSLVWLNGENVNVEPNSFDAVVVTHVLCSVQDSVQVLRQADRALKPGGKIYIMEHVAAGPEENAMRLVQQIIAPFFYIAGNGCSFKETWKDIDTALPGYKVDIEHIKLPIPLAPLAPHVLGTATKPM